MASLAESSLGSVPIPQIETLRQYMLEHTHANPSVSEQSDTKGRAGQHRSQDAPAESSTHVEVPASGTSFIPQSQDVYQTPHSSPLRVRRPNLVPSASAPVQDMESMLDLTPSQKAFHMLTKAASFHAYPDGDTQPMESQVYRDFHESMAQPPRETTPGGGLQAADHSLGSIHVSAAHRTLGTCEEGDTGYIDLERAFQPASPTSTGGFDELLVSPQTQAQATVNGNQNDGFAVPETPAFGARKHGRDGELLTSVTATTKKTPAYSQLFGMAANGSVLSATQLFNQTQAPSSPLPDQLRSDPVVTRPSPNINGHAVVSSPPEAFSSPILPTAGARSSSVADPKGTYTSMRESQERRAARFRQELGRQAKGDADLWLDENEDDPTRSHWQQQRMRRVVSDHAIMDGGKSNGRVRLNSRPSSANNMPSTISIMETPATVQRGERLEFDDEFLENDSGQGAEDEEDGDDDEEVGDEEPNDNDEYDELAQVLRSQANEEDIVDGAGPRVRNRAMQPGDELRDDGIESNAADPHHPVDRPSTQHSAIADSQAGTQEKQRSKLINHGGHHSSSASFIPGSQYTGRTSEDQARLAPSQYTRPSRRIVQDKIPSSPPLPVDDGSKASTSAEASGVYVPHIERPTDLLASVGSTANVELEVPESDLPEPSRPRVYGSASQGGSHSLPLFSTAQTHASTHATSKFKANRDVASPSKPFASQHSRVSDFSPRKAAGVRHFSEFASITPPDGTGQTQADVEAVMNDVMTTEDREYMAAMSDTPGSNTHKRRKLDHHFSANGALTSGAEKLPQKERDTINSAMYPDADQDGEDTNSRSRRSSSPVIPRVSSGEADASRSSTTEPDPAQYFTPSSVQIRERAGAQAVSRLVSGRTTRGSKKSKSAKAARKSGTAKLTASRSHPTNDTGQETPNVGAVKSHHNPKAPEQKERSVGPIPNGVQGGTEPASSRHPRIETSGIEPKVSNPERTFALFKGRYNQYFPATWIGFSRDKPTHRIQFDDTTVTDIETQHICALDLRIGDTVKVDLANMRKESWVVVGFAAVTATSGLPAASADIRGRSRVLVQAKSARNSVRGGNVATLSEAADVHEVLITNVYITHTMWKHFSDRTFEPPVGAATTEIRVETPSRRTQTPNFSTPGSRSRRSAQSNAQGPFLKITTLRDGPLTPPLPVVPGGVFKNMAFAVSYSPEDADRKRADTAALIRQNGGIVFDDSFLDLFDVPSPGDKRTGPQTVPVSKNAGDDILTPKIRAEFADLGFVALISDQHHRKAKYIQALALGLPTLSVRWITDCLDAGKNPTLGTSKATPLGWGKYLLPAGESSYLQGAVRSRTLTPEDATWAKFSTTISVRPRLLQNQGVVILSGKNKNTRENRDMFAFLALALGARSVRRAANLQEARALLEQEIDDWEWVFVDGEVAEAAGELFENSALANPDGGKKRKRGQEPARSAAKLFTTNGKVTIVNDEFVIQSLILGALVD